jgi:hypothetical protein
MRYTPQLLEDPKLSIEQLRGRWRVPAGIVRFELKKAGIKLVPIPRKPVDGARLRDILDFEEQVKAGIISSGIRPNPSNDEPPLRIVPNREEPQQETSK